jgi:diguanylate cyclase (GGDEF)-like protein
MPGGVRRDRELSRALIDVDHFKKVNDGLSHQVGDDGLVACLRRVGHVLRQGELLARLMLWTPDAAT